MGKLFVFDMVSLNGFFAGPKGELDWHNVDDEFNEFAVEQIGEIDKIVFGRVTYEMMASYWPTEAAIKNDPIVAKLMNDIPKVVVSRTLKTADWGNTNIINGDLAQNITELKRKSVKDIAIFGSSKLFVSLLDIGLIDEIRVMVNPVVLVRGRALFEGVEDKLDLKLVDSRSFKSGNVLLRYRPAAL